MKKRRPEYVRAVAVAASHVNSQHNNVSIRVPMLRGRCETEAMEFRVSTIMNFVNFIAGVPVIDRTQVIQFVAATGLRTDDVFDNPAASETDAELALRHPTSEVSPNGIASLRCVVPDLMCAGSRELDPIRVCVRRADHRCSFHALDILTVNNTMNCVKGPLAKEMR